MKLRNKKTGEIKECVVIPIDDNGYPNEYQVFDKGDSLAELNEGWEDYEEPKRHWIIDTMNDRVEDFDVPMDFNESIGNYFETREEAEKAVEKLKAWKRLRLEDKIIDWKLTREYDDFTEIMHVNISFSVDSYPLVGKDLDLLFGGEE